MSTISTMINHGVTIGAAGYSSPLTITATGYVNYGGSPAAVFSRPIATVVNYGVIRSEGGGNYGGVELLSSSSLDNHGTIESNWYAVYMYGGVLTNEGNISSGSRFGVFGRGVPLSIVNAGLISGAVAIEAISGLTLSNTTGTISGSVGVQVSGGTGSLINSGVIAGGYGAGVNLGSGGSVTNTATGYISSHGIYAGISISGGAGAVTNSGTVSGYRGMEFYAAGIASQTVIDSGTIVGSGGEAVAFGAGNDLMRLQSGSPLIHGTVDGGGGVNTLEFVAGTGTLTGDGADFVNFGASSVDAGGQWSIDGNVTLGAGVDLTVAGSLTVAGTLENAGTISPVSYAGLRIAAGGYLLNDASGTIVNNTSNLNLDPTVFGVNASNVTVVNFGTIEDPAGNASIYLSGGGMVVNGSATDTSALISGLQGIYAHYGAATVTNFGSIVGSLGDGIALAQSGVVINGAAGSTSAVVSGAEYGVLMASGSGMVTNFGTISSSSYGIDMHGGAGTVVDSGVIVGGTAMSFGGNDNLLVLENGFSVTGAIAASGTGNVVELRGSTGAAVTAAYNTLDLSGFQTAAFAQGNGNYATWVITDTARLPGTIAGFTGTHDAIDLTTLSDTNNDATTSFDTLTNVLTVTGDNGTVQLQLDSEDYTGTVWTALNDGGNGTEVTPACFCAGTAIATPRGDVPVERLREGDLVLTHSGASRPIRWIGHRHLDLTRHPAPDRVRPIRIRANAFADGEPTRDLFVSPDHALHVDGLLVPARLLLNGASIRRDVACRTVTYYHVELETHDVLLAENLAAESYLDTGNRGLFENAGPPLLLHPDLANDQARRVAGSCAPFADDSARVEPIWRALAARAENLGLRLPPEPEITDDPALCLVVEGRRMAPVSVARGRYVFALPRAGTAARLMSRSAVAGETRPWVADDRRLGVLLRGLTLRSGALMVPIPLDHPAFGEGWWQPEWHNSTGLRRWTNGNALVPMPEADLMEPGACLLEVEIAATLPYPLPAAREAGTSERLFLAA